MTPGELVAVITDADAAEPPGKRRIILEVRAPVLLGFKGKYLGHDDGGPVYGYRRRDALRMVEMIYAAAREDAAATGEQTEDGFGDGA